MREIISRIGHVVHNLSYGEAWAAWLAGQQLSGHVLWGVSMVWWGRIGDILQAMGALTVLAEIIGADRLRFFGNSLHSALTFKHVHEQIDTARTFVRYSIAYARADTPNSKELLKLLHSSPYITLDLWLGIIVSRNRNRTLDLHPSNRWRTHCAGRIFHSFPVCNCLHNNFGRYDHTHAGTYHRCLVDRTLRLAH